MRVEVNKSIIVGIYLTSCYVVENFVFKIHIYNVRILKKESYIAKFSLNTTFKYRCPVEMWLTPNLDVFKLDVSVIKDKMCNIFYLFT